MWMVVKGHENAGRGGKKEQTGLFCFMGAAQRHAKGRGIELPCCLRSFLWGVFIPSQDWKLWSFSAVFIPFDLFSCNFCSLVRLKTWKNIGFELVFLENLECFCHNLCPTKRFSEKFCTSWVIFFSLARVGPSPQRDCWKRPRPSIPGGARQSNPVYQT